MNRRDLLKMLGLSAAGLALAPKKFYFDYGANLWKQNNEFEWPEFDWVPASNPVMFNQDLIKYTVVEFTAPMRSRFVMYDD